VPSDTQQSHGKRQEGSKLGPRGGLTTVTPGGLNRLSTYILPAEREAVRRRAFEEDTSISEVIRDAIRAYLGLP
jgi:hypothetical protein